MADPFRLRVTKALTTALGEISVAGGYNYDMAGRVFRGRARYGDDDPDALLSILEDPREIDQQTAETVNISRGQWKLLIQGFAVDDPVNPTDNVSLLLADTKRRLALLRSTARTSNNWLGLGSKSPCVTDVIFGGGVCRPSDNFISIHSFFWLPLTLTLVEDHENP